MKELILHIGCSKTGSSALQSWLAINQAGLADQGYQCAVLDNEAKNFKINSGNGAVLDTYIRQTYEQARYDHKKGQEILDLYFSGYDRAIISSEILSGFSPKNIQKLRRFFDQHQIKVTVIAYVRNLYDFFYSAHVQHVKRTNRLISFERAVLEEKQFRHFLSYRNFSPFFDVTLIHYDSVIDNIALPFCDAVELDYSRLLPLPAKQVNRTLSYGEIEVVQTLGSWLAQMKIVVDNFSITISDELVHQFPEVESEVVYSESVYQYLSKTFGKQLDEFNTICEKQFGFKLSILSDRPYAALSENQPMDRTTLEQVLAIICDNSAKFDRRAIEALSEKFSTCTDYQSLSLKLNKSLTWKNRFKQLAKRMSIRFRRLSMRNTNRRMFMLRLKESLGVYR
ncbi:Uncharacterised protein [Halioglobus japonicus]|nr:Uncharacterised protein [Halioglobus japonicus]